MKKVIFVIIFIICFMGLCLYLVTFYDNKNEIQLVECVDGDTAWFIINGKKEKVRFLGIDTPESTIYIEEYGKEASNYTCKLLNKAKYISIEYDMNSDSRDKYDRVLGWIFVDNNNLSELLLSKGYANVDYIYGNYKYVEDLCIAQEEAYVNKLGIWNVDYYNYQDNYCVINGY